MNIDKDFLTVIEFAAKLRIHPRSVRAMIKKGRLSAFRVGGGSKSAYRIAITEITRLAVVDLECIVQDMVEKKIKDRK